MLKNVTFTPQPYPSWNLLIQPQSADMPKRLQFFGIHSLHYPVTCHLVLGEAQGRWFDMSTSRLMVLPNSFVNISSGKPTFSQSFSSLKMLKFKVNLLYLHLSKWKISIIFRTPMLNSTPPHLHVLGVAGPFRKGNTTTAWTVPTAKNQVVQAAPLCGRPLKEKCPSSTNIENPEIRWFEFSIL